MGNGLSNKMKLSYAEIHNFRSISHIKLFFSPSCRALVGINETGKSNILKALSLLGNKYKPSSDDIRITLPDEPPVTQAYIRFVFLLSEEDVRQIYEALKKSVFTLNFEKSLISKDGKKLNLQEFCRLRNEGIYYVDLLKKDKTLRYYKLQSGYRTLGNWKKASDIVSDAKFLIETNGKKLPLEDFSLIDIEDCKEIPHQNFSDITPEYVNKLVGEEIIKFIKENLPNVILWAYDEKNILPPSVNITTFSINPDICTPLKNMFYLAKIDDIYKEITESMAGAKPLLRNLLNKVADQSTKHFRQIWKEYKTIEFGLSPNGENIDATIKDTFNHYEMSQRSDGFKRFVSFLLIISALVKTNKLGNALILIDEPDISLHPSGTRYLRDELIRISKTNLIIYSSHSIFMVDENNIKRHIIGCCPFL
jgi:predicted ATP-dependent endonuclease of OLD family